MNKAQNILYINLKNWLRFHSCRVDNRILQYGFKSSLIPEWSSRFMRGKSRNHCLTGKTKDGKRLLNPLTLKPKERKWAKPVGWKLIRPIGNQKARLTQGLSGWQKTNNSTKKHAYATKLSRKATKAKPHMQNT